MKIVARLIVAAIGAVPLAIILLFAALYAFVSILFDFVTGYRPKSEGAAQ